MENIRIKYFTDRIDKLEYIDGKSDWIDLRASETVELKAGEFKLIPLGVAMELPSFEEMRQRLKDNAEEKINSEKENKMLISNIAHDLKTPITAVKGYAEGLMDGVADTPEKRDKYIRTIYNKANEMDTLINELRSA